MFIITLYPVAGHDPPVAPRGGCVDAVGEDEKLGALQDVDRHWQGELTQNLRVGHVPDHHAGSVAAHGHVVGLQLRGAHNDPFMPSTAGVIGRCEEYSVGHKGVG
eukprot:8671683-Pyramimonas_sp.AAC.1